MAQRCWWLAAWLLPLWVAGFARGQVVSFQTATSSVSENATNLSVVVTRTPAAGLASVSFATADGTATAPLDYSFAAGNLSFGIGEVVKVITVPITDDALPEVRKTFSIRLFNVTGATLGISTNVVTIVDDDTFFALSSPSYFITEGATNVLITVNRLGSFENPSSVRLFTANGTAIAGVDYFGLNTSLIFAVGQTSAAVNVGIIDNFTVNPGASFQVVLTNAVAAQLSSPGAATVTIFDNDSTNGTVQITSFAQAAAETNGGTTVTINVARLGGTNGAITVDFFAFNSLPTNLLCVLGTNATPGVDFTGETGTLTWADGVSSDQVITLTILDDNLVEIDEVVVIALRNATGGAIINANRTAVVTILSDDQPPGAADLLFNPATVLNPGPGANNSVYAAAVNTNLGDPNFGFITMGGDFTAVNATVRNRIARLGTNGLVDLSFNPGTGADGPVHVVLLQTNGQTLIGGSFTSFNNIGRRGVARLNVDGSLDASFDPGAGVNGVVNAMLLQGDGRLLVAGDFTAINNTPRSRIARLNADGSLDATFSPGTGPDGPVHALALNFVLPGISVGSILVGGRFDSFNGVPQANLIRLLSDGSVDFRFNPVTGPDATVLALQVQPDEAILVGGSFQNYDSLSRRGLARVTPNGLPDLTFDPQQGVDGLVWSLGLQTNGLVIVGGSFTTFAGVRRANVARLHTNGTLETSFLDPFYNRIQPGLSGPAYAVAVQPDNQVVVGGAFTQVGAGGQPTQVTTRWNLARLLGGDIQPAPNMPGNVELIAATFEVNENVPGGALNLGVRRLNGFQGPLVVDYGTRDGSAVAGRDYLARSGSVSFAECDPLSTVRFFSVPIVDNALIDGNRSFQVFLTSPRAPGGVSLPALGFIHTATNTIVDDEFAVGTVGFAAAVYTVNENAGVAAILVTRTNGAIGIVGVSYAATAVGSATAGQDFTPVSGTLTFNSSQTNATFNVPILDDTGVEFEERVSLTLANPTGGVGLGLTTATLLIYDNDNGPGTLGFTSGTLSVNESAGNLSVDVRRNSGAAGTVTVQASTVELAPGTPGAARAGIDYNSVVVPLTFGAGVTNQTFLVPILTDRLVEGDEIFRLQLSGATGGASLGFLSGPTTVTVVDDDAYGRLGFAAASFSINERQSFPAVTITRTGGDSDEVKVDFYTSSGSALAGLDFVTVSNRLTFADGERSQTLFVLPLNDGQLESAETVLLTLTSFSKALPGVFTNAVLTIYDDEAVNIPAGAVDTSYLNGMGGSVNALVLLPNGQFVAAGDITNYSGQDVSRLVRVRATGLLDPTFQPARGVNGPINALALQPDGRLLVAGAFTTFNFTNHARLTRLRTDGAIDSGFNPGAGADGEVLAVAVQADGKILIGGAFITFNGVTRPYLARLLTDGSLDTAFNPGLGPDQRVNAIAVQADGQILVGGEFSQVNGVARARVARLNPDGSLDGTFAPGTGANAAVRALLLLPDGSLLAGGSFTNFNGSARGGLARLLADGSLDAAFPAGGTGTDGVVLALARQPDGRLLVGGEFTRYNGVSSGRLVRLLANGAVDPSINFGLGADGHIGALVVQPDEKIIVGGGFATFNGTRSVNLARLVGGENAGAGTFEFAAPVVTVTEGGAPVVVTVQRLGGLAGAASVGFNTADGTALAGTHYTASSGSLAFPEGEVRQTFQVLVLDNAVLDPDLVVNLRLHTPSGAGLGTLTNAQLVIRDNDGTVGFSAATFSVNENVVGGRATITVTRAGATNVAVVANFTTTTNGTATPGVDFAPTNTVLIFAPGELVKTVTVAVANDLAPELPETVGLSLTNLQFIGLTSATMVPGITAATLTIVDDEVAPGVFNFSAPTFTVSESLGTVLATITVVRINGVSGGIVSVGYATSDGTARAGLDYQASSGTLAFADGETSKTFTVSVLADLVSEAMETVNLSLLNPTGGAALGLQSSALLLIQNNNGGLFGNLGFSGATYSAVEGAGVAVLTVNRLGGTGNAVGVAYATTTNGTAVAGVHYPAVNSNFLSWAAGDGTPKTISLPLTDNPLVDGNRTVELVLFSPTGGAELDRLTNATLTIVDDDLGPGVIGFASPAISVLENATNALVVVTRTNGFTGAVTAQFNTFTDVSDRAGAQHYVTTARTVAFADGVTSQTVLVPLLDNALQEGSKTFTVRLSGATGGAALGLTNAVVRILDDEPVAGAVDEGLFLGSGLNGNVNSIRVATNGQILLGGEFSQFNGVARSGLARLNRDGSLDVAFNPVVDSSGPLTPASVRALAVVISGTNAGKVVVGGLFPSINSVLRPNLARLNVDGSTDLTFNSGAGVNNLVSAVEVQSDGRLVLGGAFTAVGGASRNFVARMNFDGTVDATFNPGSGPDGQVRALVLQADGKVMIAGDFNNVAGVPNRRVARLNSDGTVDPTFAPGGLIPSGTVFSLAVQVNGQVLVGGLFTTTNAVPRANLIRLNLDGSLDTAFNLGTGFDEFVSAVTLQADGKILVGGAFTRFSGLVRNRLVRLDTTGASDHSFNLGTGADELVAALAVQPDSKILVGGAFTTFNGVPQNRFTRLHGGTNLGSGELVFSAPQFTVSEAGTNGIITVVRTGGSSNEVTVDFATTAGGTAPVSDFTATNGTLTFAPGVTHLSFNVPVRDKLLVDGDRTVALALANPTGGGALGARAAAVLVVQDNDSVLGFNPQSYAVSENSGSATITVQRVGGVIEPVAVSFYTRDDTGTNGLDYVATNGVLAFASGQSNAIFTVEVLARPGINGNRRISLNLSNATGSAVLGIGLAQLVIVDNDFGPGTLGFQVSAVTVAEAAHFLTLNVGRTNGLSGSVSVRYATADGSAQAFPVGGLDTNQFDYYFASGQLNFADGETNKEIRIEVIDNNRIDDSRTFTVGLFSPGGAATLGLATNLVTILDGPESAIGQLFFTSTNYTVGESAGIVQVEIGRNRGTAGQVGVIVSTEDLETVSGLDYVATRQLVVLNDGQIRRTVQLSILSDGVPEGPESFLVRLSNPTGGARLADSNTFARVTIVDDDSLPGVFAFSTNIYSVKEGETALITVIRTNGSVGRAEVDVSLSSGFSANPQFLPATNGIHYNAAAGIIHLTFFEGETVKRFTVPTITDPRNLPNYITLDPNEPANNLPTEGNNSFLTAPRLPRAVSYAQFAGPFHIYAPNFGVATRDDTDFYLVELEAGTNYHIRAWTEVKDEAAGTDQLELALFDYPTNGPVPTLGAALRRSGSTVGDPAVLFIPPTNGTYVLQLRRTSTGDTRNNEHIRYFIDYGPTDVNDSDFFVRRRGAAVRLTLGNATGGATVSGSSELRILDISHLNYPGGVFLLNSTNGVSGSSVTGRLILRRQDVDLNRGFEFEIGSFSGEIPDPRAVIVDQTLPILTAGSVAAAAGTNITLFYTAPTNQTDLQFEGIVSFAVSLAAANTVTFDQDVRLRLVRRYNNLHQRNTDEDDTTITFQTIFGTAPTPQPPGAADLNFNPDFSAASVPPFNSLPGANAPVLSVGVINSSFDSLRALSAVGDRTNVVTLSGFSGTLSLSFASADPRVIEIYYGDLLVNPAAPLIRGVTNLGGIQPITVTVPFGPIAGVATNELTIVVRNLDPAAPGTTLWTVNGSAVVNLGAPLSVIGGEFTGYNSTPLGRIARVDNRGYLDPNFNAGLGFNGFVSALGVVPRGGNASKLYAGGSFTSFDSTTRNYLARLFSNGPLDTNFNPSAVLNGPVRAIGILATNNNPLVGGELVYVGGDFTPRAGLQPNRMARLRSDGSLDTTFDTGTGFNGTVRALAVYATGTNTGKVLVGGDFTAVNGQIFNRIVRLDFNGQVDPTFFPGDGFDGPVYGLAIQPDGAIIAVGGFRNCDLRTRNHVARLNSDGSLDETYETGSGFDDVAYAVTLEPGTGKAFIGGSFVDYNGTRRRGVARLLTDGSLDTSFMDATFNHFAGLHRLNPGPDPADQRKLIGALAVEPGGNLLVGGTFDLLGGGPQRVDKDAGNTFPRQDLRRRNNFARLVGGVQPLAPGNISFTDQLYSVDEFATNRYVTLTRANGTLGAASVNFTTLDRGVGSGLASAGVDYQTTSGSPLWPDRQGGLNFGFAQAGTANIQVPIIDDLLIEGNENFAMLLGAPLGLLNLGGEIVDTGAALGRIAASIVIVDDDGFAGVLGFAQSEFVVQENLQLAQISVTRTNGSRGLVSVDFATPFLGTNDLNRDFPTLIASGLQQATAALDYIPVSGTLSFAAGQTNATFAVPLLNDSVRETDEFIPLYLSSPRGGARLGFTNALLLIVDDDLGEGSAGFTSARYTVSEASGSVAVTVERRGGSTGIMRVGYAARAFGGTVTNAAGLSDFTPTAGTLTWNDGESGVKQFTVAILQNNEVAAFPGLVLVTNGLGIISTNLGLYTTNLVVELGLTSVSLPGGLSRTNATLEIQDDDTFGFIGFERAQYSVNELAGNASIFVVRTAGAGSTLVASITVADGAPSAGTNFTGSTNTLVFLPGETSKGVLIPIFDDGVINGDRRVAMQVQAAFPRIGASDYPNLSRLAIITNAVLRIVDDESFDQGAGSVDVTFRASGSDAQINALTVGVDDAIYVGGLFNRFNGISRRGLARLTLEGELDLNFAWAGAFNGPVRGLAIQGAGLTSLGKVLASGSFTLVEALNRRRITRFNQDGTQDLSFEPGGGTDNPVFGVLVEPGGGMILHGGFTTFDGVQRNGVARLSPDGLLDATYNAGLGVAGAVYAVARQADGKLVVGGSILSVGSLTATNLARLNLDGTPDVTFTTNAYVNGEVRVLIAQPDGKVIVAGEFTQVAGGGATNLARLNADGTLDTSFTAAVNGPVYALALQADGRILLGGNFESVNGIARNRFARLLPGGGLDYEINFGAGPNGVLTSIGLQSDGKILLAGDFTEFDGVPRDRIVRLHGGTFTGRSRIEFLLPLYTVDEDAGALLIPIRRSGPVGETNAVSARLFVLPFGTDTNLQAQSGIHYLPLDAQTNVTFGLGHFFTTNRLTILDNFAVESNRSLVLGLETFSTNALPGNQTNAVVTIRNDDSLVGFALANYFVSEGLEGGLVQIEMVRSGGTSRPASVRVSTGTNGTATSGLDYGPLVDVPVLFLPGESSKFLSLQLTNDALVELNETIELFALLATGGLLDRTNALLTIVDDDTAPGQFIFLTNNFPVSEDLTNTVARITVQRINGNSGVITVQYDTADGTATNGLDYLRTSGILAFADGETVKTFTVPILADTLSETNGETVNVFLFNPTGGASLGTPSAAVLTIANNDGLLYGNFLFTAPAYTNVTVTPFTNVLAAVYTNRENAGPAVITVTRIGGLQGPVSVRVVTETNGTALPGVHFTGFNGRLNWADGEGGGKTFTLPVVNNALVDGDRTVVLTLADPVNGTSLNVPSLAVVTIQDDDFGPGVFGFTNVVFNALESDTNAVVWVSRTNGFTGTSSVQYATFTGGSDLAVPGQHYTSTNGTLVFTNGVTNLSFNVPVADNGQQDGIRTFSVRLSGATGGALLGLSTAVVRILDNEPAAGSVDPGFLAGLGPNGSVLAIQLATNGQSLLVGDFSGFDGQPREKVARVNLDGTLDATFNAGGVGFPVTNTVQAIARALTNATEVTITTATPHGLVPGTNVTLTGVDRLFMNGVGFAVATVPTPTNFTYQIAPVVSPVVNVSRLTGTNTLRTAVPHRLAVGDTVDIAGLATASFNGPFVVDTTPSPFTFTVLQAGPDVVATPDLGIVRLLTVPNGPVAPGPGLVTHLSFLGRVSALAVYVIGAHADKVVIGGNFSTVGTTARANVARLNVNGSVDLSFDPGTGANNTVRAVGVAGSGHVVLGGAFTTVNGVARNFIARLNPDGTVDNTFVPGVGPDAQVRALALQPDGKVIIAGDFDTVAGVPHRRVARLNGDGTLDPTFLPGGLITNGTVFSLLLQLDGQILVAGQFTTTNAVARTNLIRLSATGALDPSFNADAGLNVGAAPNDFVVGLAVQADGRILVGGSFTTFNGIGRNNLVRLDSTGAVDPTFNIGTGANDVVAALAVQRNRDILVGGAFTTFNGVAANHFTRLHGGTNLGAGGLSFSQPLFTVSEGGTNATLTVVRSGGASNTVTVDYTVIPGGTAVAGVDFFVVGGTLTFAPGETRRTFIVPVIDEIAVRPDRTVFLSLANVTGGATLENIPPTTVLVIQDNDSLVDFAAATFSVVESATNALVTVLRSGGTNELVTVDFFTAARTATLDVDFTNQAGSLTFAPGVTNLSFLVPVMEDAFIEGSETVALFLTNAGPVGIGSLGLLTNATLTIVDNDFGPGVLGFELANFTYFENVGLAAIKVVRTNGSVGVVSVNFATVDGVGNATAGVDYRGTNGILNFADGEVSKTFNVPLIDDVVVESNETLALVLLGTTGGAGLGLTNTTLTIVDDDAFGTFQFSTNSYTVVESTGSVSVTVVRSSGIIGAVSVDFVTVGGSATAGVDYIPVFQVLNFAPGQTTTNITVQVINDQVVEPLETISLVLTNPTAGALLGSLTNSTITITDDDMQFSFALTNFTVLENDGTAVVNVLRYGVTNVAGTVDYATSDGAATNRIDYVGVTNTLTFLPGVINTNFTVLILDNQVVQLNRALNLQLLNATPTNNASPGTNAAATLTIVDNDNTFSFSLLDYVVGEAAGQLQVSVLRLGQNTGAVSVAASTFTLPAVNAATAGTDYVTSASTLVFAPGQSSVNFTVLIVADQLPEGDEVFGLALNNPLPVGAALLGPTNVATGTIIDDDIGIGFSSAAYTVNETAGSKTITVIRSGVTNVAVGATFFTTNGTALAGVDYTAASSVLAFLSGVNSRTVTVPIINDSIAETPETVSLVLTNPTGGAFLTISNAILTIADNVGSIGFAATNFLVGESRTNGVVVVTRTGGSSGAVTVDYLTTTGGTATSGLDYADVAGTLSWANGESGSKTFTVQVFDDQFVEATETIALRLANVTGGAGFGLTNANLSIVDNDGPGGVDFVFDPGVGFNDSVYAVAQQTNGQLLAAGLFTSFNGSNRARVARLNRDGALDTSYNVGLGPDNGVNSIALQSDGRLVIVGDFTSVGGSLRSRVARLLADGSLDTAYTVGSGANSTVSTVAIQADGKAVIGGNFTNYNGTARSRIARLNTSGSLDSTFNPGTGANGFVNAIVVYASGTNSGKMLVGGSFITFNGTSVNRLVRLNASGTIDTTFNTGTGANSTVATIAIQTDGKIVVGGVFSSINGVSRSRLARLNHDGSLDTTFFPVMNDTVLSVVVQPNGSILAGGAFTLINGDIGTPPAPGSAVSLRERTGNVVTLTTTGAHSLAIGSRVMIGTNVGVGFDGTFTVTAVPSSTRFRYVSAGADVVSTAVTPNGSFSATGSAVGRITRLLADGTIDSTFATGSGADNLIFTVLLQSDFKVVLAGDFSTVNNAVRGRIARLNGNSNTPVSNTLGSGGFVSGQFVLGLDVEPGRQYRIEFSTDLRTWTVLTTVNSGHGVLTFTDTASVGSARRYYRAIQLP